MRYLVVLLLSLLVFAFSPGDLPQVGKASFYSNKFHNRKTACGERYCKDSFTAAHRTLPFGALVRVVNLDNGKHVVVRINDRGPYSHSRVIDLSYAAAKEIGMIGAGIAKVRVEEVSDIKEPIGPVPAEEITAEGVKVVEALDTGIMVQAGAYRKSENLQKALEQLKGAGFGEVTVLQDITYSRVILGPFTSNEEATQILAKLKEQNIDAFVIRR